MEKSYIDANELIAEIERLINDKTDDRHVPPADIVAPKRCGYEEILTLVKSFQQEQPDADLEAEIQDVIYDPLYDLDGVAIKGATKYITVEDVADLARYFAEWGAIHPKAIQSLQQKQPNYKKLLDSLLEAISYSYAQTDGTYGDLAYVVSDKVKYINNLLRDFALLKNKETEK